MTVNTNLNMKEKEIQRLQADINRMREDLMHTKLENKTLKEVIVRLATKMTDC